jgi:hypothetical protein
MTNLFSSLAAQFGVGFASFAVSSICILAAAGPAQLLG